MLMTEHGTFGPDRRRLQDGEAIKADDFQMLRKQGHESDSYIHNSYYDLIGDGDPIIGTKFSVKYMKPIFRCTWFDKKGQTTRDCEQFSYKNTIDV